MHLQDRLPKLALFGTWIQNTSNPIRSHNQLTWLHHTLVTADIHPLDFFRLAQNLDATKWEHLIKRAFPISRLPPTAARQLNRWRHHQPLPDNSQIRLRRTRHTWHKPASQVPANACPVCAQQFPKLQALQHHYHQSHAITDPAITTFSSFQCSECRKTFTTPYARLNHECRILYAVPDADHTDLFGWKPHSPPNIDPIPLAWKLYTDGSFNPHHPANAGWGVAIYSNSDLTDTNCLCELYAPVCLDKEDQRYLGAEQASNNTGELTAIAEALTWLKEECPGPADTPAEIIYDSRYAADLTLGVTEPHANHTLAQQCHALYRAVTRTRPLSFRWVKGHSNVPGNDKADELADKGRNLLYCSHSRRWAAPKTNALTQANAETCRKCGRIFQNARKYAKHELLCTAQPQPHQEPDLEHQPCRICKEAFTSRKLRNTHELTCNGSHEANLACKFCQKTFDTTVSRIFHQGSCTQKQMLASPSRVHWTCPRCNWKIIKHKGQGPSKIEGARNQHTQQCRGSDLLNRTCTKCNKVWDSMTARLAHHSQCKTDEEQRTCRCCNQLWETKDRRISHEKVQKRRGTF